MNVGTLDSYLAETKNQRLESLMRLLSIPSISTDPNEEPHCREAAALLVDHLRSIGMEHVEACETDGLPVVYADWLHAPGAPTAGVYAHYDVQPADPIEGWNVPPFQPAIVGDRLLGRGSADDKGQVHIHLSAVEALLRTTGRLPMNIKFLFDGEEEIGSPSLAGWLGANRRKLDVDFFVISDTTFFDGNVPAITLSLRGIAYAEVDVYGSPNDLHSGVFGGVVQNPCLVLSQILASMRDKDGRVRIPGFYDDVVELTDDERSQLLSLPFDEAAYQRQLTVPELFGEAGYRVLERRSTRPSFDINGMWGGYQGPGRKTIIPASAHAKISFRLVPDQDPQCIMQLVERHIRGEALPGVRVEVRSLGGSRGVMIRSDHPITQAASRAVFEAFGREPVYKRGSGSIAACSMLAEQFNVPMILLGFVQPDDNEHAPNEWLDLDNYENGIRAVSSFWNLLPTTHYV